jgi:hypothetical protein
LIRDPLVVYLSNVEPKAAHTVHIKRDEEDQLEQLHSVLPVLVHVQAGDDSAESCHSNQLQTAKEGKLFSSFASENVAKSVKGDSREEVDQKLAFKVHDR